jgi:hypothetical protein
VTSRGDWPDSNPSPRLYPRLMVDPRGSVASCGTAAPSPGPDYPDKSIFINDLDRFGRCRRCVARYLPSLVIGMDVGPQSGLGRPPSQGSGVSS